MSPEVFIQSILPMKTENLARVSYTAVIPDVTRVDLAGTISSLIMEAAQNGDMLPKTPQDILGFFSKGDSMVLIDKKDGKFLSHAAITDRYKDGSVEVGGVCTAKDKQRNGFATDVTEALLIRIREREPNTTIITLANEKSKGLFQRLGGTEMDPAELDKEVWSACKDCKKKPPASANGEFKCCDTPFNLTSFGKKDVAPPILLFDVGAHTNGTNGTNHAKI